MARETRFPDPTVGAHEDLGEALSDHRQFFVDQLTLTDAYKLIVGAVQPRPIAWVSTQSPTGVRNLAPFSFFNVVSTDPLMVMISIGAGERPDESDKDTLKNVRAMGEFVVNVVSEPLLMSMVATSEPVPAEVDEFELTGLEAADSVTVRPPRVADAQLALECVLEEIRAYGGDHVVVGRVRCIHAAPGIVTESFRVETTRLRPVGRMAGQNFCIGLVPEFVSLSTVALDRPPTSAGE